MEPLKRLRAIGEIPKALLLLAIVIYVNGYIARDLFSFTSAENGSMHGFWTALAAHFGSAWFHPTWWPYWDAGIPIEATYAPLVPGLAALIVKLRHVTPAIGFSSVSGLVYILTPCTLFIAAWRLTRDLRASFAGAMVYSFTSLPLVVVPDKGVEWGSFFEARRLFVLANWDDTPHCTALLLLPLIILFLARSIETRRWVYYAASAATIAAAALASAFGPVMTFIAAVCLLFTLKREQWRSNLMLVAGLGAWGYAIASPFLSPSLMLAIRDASDVMPNERWSIGSFSALAFTVLGFVIVLYLVRRFTSDWRVQFASLFFWVMCSIPIAHSYIHRHFLPQPFRYHFEMELAAAFGFVFLVHNWPFGRWTRPIPASVKFGVLLLLVAFGVEEINDYRKLEKSYTFPKDLTATVEYRVANWARQYDPSVRYYFAGSVALWADRFADLQQFTGESYTMATNEVQQNALRWITESEDTQRSIAWLKAYGVAVMTDSAADSKEYWKPFFSPGKFRGVLQPLWSESGVTAYRVPVRETSLAHVVPAGSIVRDVPQDGRDSREVERYVAGLDDASMPPASFQWEGHNRIRIHTTLGPGQVVTVQESYHPGWHSTVPIHKDGLGLMWLQPGEGPVEIVLDYDGGWELRLCRWLSWLAIGALVVVPLKMRRRMKTLLAADERR
jgi:hypothetical protein